MMKLRAAPARYRVFDGVVRFDPLEYIGRVRATRSRMQRVMTYSVPICVADYKTPAFYYSETMDHRRQRDLDCGVSKVRNGIWNAKMIMEGVNADV